MPYIIYMHTINNKQYIGYTKKVLQERLDGHIKEALSGSERHFCRAIRKYGISEIRSKVIDTATTVAEAKRLERKYIKEYSTFELGYNMTEGGDGGNTTSKYDKIKMQRLSELRSKRSKGLANGNSSGKTKEEILELAFTVLQDNNRNWVRKDYMKRAKELGYPVNIQCSGMFDKSWRDELLEYAKNKGMNLDEIGYKPTTEHVTNNAGVRKKGGKWFYNDLLQKSKYYNPEELDNISDDWQPGRKLKWD